MSDPDLYIYLVSIILLIILSAFFSASETAFISFGKHHFQKISGRDEEKAKRLGLWFDNPQKVLVTALVGNNIVNILAAVILTVASYRFWPRLNPAAITLLLTFVILIFGEIIPKSFAKKHSESIAYHISPLITFFCVVFTPAIKFLIFFSRGLVKLFGGNLESILPVLTEEDIKAMIIAGEEEGIIQEEEKNMIDSIFDLGETMVREIMIPRVKIVAVKHDTDVKNILNVIASEGYSRLPVYRENLDKITGIVYIKDIIAYGFKTPGSPDKIKAEEFMRDAYFIPETKKVSDLMKELQARKMQMAIVVDEYGGTAGIVTMEDLVEEIVGEISDEYKKEAKEITHLSDGSFLVYGGIEIEKANEEMELEIPEGEFETIAGFVLAHFGKFPVKGESFVYGKHQFTIYEADHKKVRLVRIKNNEEVNKNE